MIVALDPGYGNTKVCANGLVATIQSAVARPKMIGMAAVGMKTAAPAMGVSMFDAQAGGKSTSFVVGYGAWRWGDPLGGMDFTALSSEPRRALFYSALAQIVAPGKHVIDHLVIGLPVPLLQDQGQAEMMFSSLKGFKGIHAFEADIPLIGGGSRRESYQLDIRRLQVLAQPVGAYANWLISDELKPRKGANVAEVAVMDLGMNTLDLYVVQGGKVNPRYIGGGKVGVRRLLAEMNGHGQDVEELDWGLRSGILRPGKGDLSTWLSEVMGIVEKTWSNLKRFQVVIPTGGGALVLGNLLSNELVSRGASVYSSGDPITANVVGLWKWGEYTFGRVK